MNENQNTETQLTQETNSYEVATGKYIAPISHTMTILSIIMIIMGLVFGMSLQVGLGITLLILNLCSSNVYVEFTKDSLVSHLIPFQKPIIIPYRKINTIDIRENVIELTLISSKGNKTKKVHIHKFSKEDRGNIKTLFSELETQLHKI